MVYQSHFLRYLDTALFGGIQFFISFGITFIIFTHVPIDVELITPKVIESVQDIFFGVEITLLITYIIMIAVCIIANVNDEYTFQYLKNFLLVAFIPAIILWLSTVYTAPEEVLLLTCSGLVNSVFWIMGVFHRQPTLFKTTFEL